MVGAFLWRVIYVVFGKSVIDLVVDGVDVVELEDPLADNLPDHLVAVQLQGSQSIGTRSEVPLQYRGPGTLAVFRPEELRSLLAKLAAIGIRLEDE